MRDHLMKKLIHGFDGLSETLHVQHKGVEFRIRFRRESKNPGSPILSEVDGPDRVTVAARADDPVWTVVAHGLEVMYYRTNFNRVLGRAEIILSAERSWRFKWDNHTTKGVPDRAEVGG